MLYHFNPTPPTQAFITYIRELRKQGFKFKDIVKMTGKSRRWIFALLEWDKKMRGGGGDKHV